MFYIAFGVLLAMACACVGSAADTKGATPSKDQRIQQGGPFWFARLSGTVEPPARRDERLSAWDGGLGFVWFRV